MSGFSRTVITMFERFTEQARRVLFFSRFEASELGSVSIEAEHILLGLIREDKGLASEIISRTNLTTERVRAALTLRDKIATSVEIPFSAETKGVLQHAAEEADSLQHNHIGSEHLLLGLLRVEQSMAASMLIQHGVKITTVREEIGREISSVPKPEDLVLKLAGYTKPGMELFRNVLFDQLYSSLPKDPQVKVQIYNAEIAPGGYTNWHCHNGATFFIALQGVFEAEFEEGMLVNAKAGDVYSEPIGKFHRGHNPHERVPYLCIGVCMTPPDREHVTNVTARPW